MINLIGPVTMTKYPFHKIKSLLVAQQLPAVEFLLKIMESASCQGVQTTLSEAVQLYD